MKLILRFLTTLFCSYSLYAQEIPTISEIYNETQVLELQLKHQKMSRKEKKVIINKIKEKFKQLPIGVYAGLENQDYIVYENSSVTGKTEYPVKIIRTGENLDKLTVQNLYNLGSHTALTIKQVENRLYIDLIDYGKTFKGHGHISASGNIEMHINVDNGSGTEEEIEMIIVPSIR